MIPLYKNKGDIQNKNNYRVIKLERHFESLGERLLGFLENNQFTGKSKSIDFDFPLPLFKILDRSIFIYNFSSSKGN